MLFDIFFKNKWSEKVKYLNGVRGVISLYLAILMVPFATIAGVLINVARTNSAVAIFDEALCNASNSTLGTYDDFLRSRFGLLALKQDLTGKKDPDTFVSETFAEYMKVNVGALSNTYVELDVSANGVYALSDPNIMYYEIMEFSKYTIPAKLTAEAFDLNDLIKNIEKYIPGAQCFNYISAQLNSAENFIKIGEEINKLRNIVSDNVAYVENYDKKYTEFYEDVKEYYEKCLELPDAEAKVTECETKKNDAETAYNNASEADKEKCKKAYDDACADLTSAENARDTIKSRITYLAETEIPTSASAYSTAIGDLSTNLGNLKTSLVALQSEVAAIQTNADSVQKAGLDMAVEQIKDENKAKIGDASSGLTKDKNDATTEEGKAAIQKQIDELNQANLDLDTQSKIAKNTIDTNSKIANVEDSVLMNSDLATKIDNIVEILNNLKTKVKDYPEKSLPESSDVSSALDESAFKTEYKYGFETPITIEQIADYEAKLLAKCMGDGILKTIEAIINFIKALTKVSLFFDPDLGACINDGLYAPQSVNENRPTFEDDRTLSQQYKDMLELDQGLSDGDVDFFGEDLFSLISNIISDVITIAKIVGELLNPATTIFVFLDFANKFKEVSDAVTGITENFTKLVDNFDAAWKNIPKKILLCGYFAYNTGNRTNYTGTALTGAKFSSYGATTSSPYTLGLGEGLEAIAKAFATEALGVEGTDKCFVGAQTEYLMYGSSSELVNQIMAFKNVYFFRLLMDIIPIITNAEVGELCASLGPFAPVGYIVFMIVEPLIETFLLVNGSSVMLSFGTVYASPSGIPKLIEKMAKMSIGNTLIADAAGLMSAGKSTVTKEDAQKMLQEDFDKTAKDWGVEKKETSGTVDSAKDDSSKVDLTKDDSSKTGDKKTNKIAEYGKTLLELSYTEHLLFIMILTGNRETLLNRFCNLVEMEANEHYNPTDRSVSFEYKAEPTNKVQFDLDNSYIGVRAYGYFSTNEFIHINTKADESLSSNTVRIVYRSY